MSHMKRAREWAERQGLLNDPDVLVKYLHYRLKKHNMENPKTIVEIRKEISARHRDYFTVEEVEYMLINIFQDFNSKSDVNDKIIAIAENENLIKVRKFVDMQ